MKIPSWDPTEQAPGWDRELGVCLRLPWEREMGMARQEGMQRGVLGRVGYRC